MDDMLERAKRMAGQAPAAPAPPQAQPAQPQAPPQGGPAQAAPSVNDMLARAQKMATTGQSTTPPSTTNSPGDMLSSAEDMMDSAGSALGGAGKGFVKGMGQTVSTVGKGVGWLAQKEHNVLGDTFMPQAGVDLVHKGTDWLDKNTELHGTAEHVGAGIEMVAEFMLGDEALKGLSLADRLGMAQKVASIAEKSPKIAKALEIGMKSLRQGAVTSTQSALKGNSADHALGEGAGMAALNAATEGVSTPLLALGEKLGMVGKSIKALQTSAELPALDKGAYSSYIADVLNKAETNMHVLYEGSINRLKDQLVGKTMQLADTPLAQVAKEWGTQTGEVLEDALKNIVPGSERMKPLLDALSKGKGEVDAEQLINLRQGLGKVYRRLPLGDGNKDIIRELWTGIDDTVSKLAEGTTGKAAEDYATARAGYRMASGWMKEPFMKKLADGSLDDVSKYLTSGGNIADKVETLRDMVKLHFSDKAAETIMRNVGANTFIHMAQNATEDGVLNVAKLARNWDKVPEAARAKLFEGDSVLGGLIDDTLNTAKQQKWAKRIIGGAVGLGGAGLVGRGLYSGDPMQTVEGILALVYGSKAGKLVDVLAQPGVLQRVGNVAEKFESPTAGRIADVAKRSVVAAADPTPTPDTHIMSISALKAKNPNASEAEINDAVQKARQQKFQVVN